MQFPVPIQTAHPVIVVLNPNAGRKQGKEQFTNIIEPALASAAVPYRVIETTGRDHARLYFKENIQQFLNDAAQVSGQVGGALDPNASLRIMILGGDGTVYEIVNGVLDGLEERPVSDLSNPRIDLSVIPLGSGNAIATSLGHTTVLEALGCFLRSRSKHPIPMRIMSVSTRQESSQDGNGWIVQTHTLVVNSFGLHCSTVHDGDGLRFLGNDRFKVSALKNIAFLKQYAARVDLQGPVQKYDANLQALTPFAAESQHQDHPDGGISGADAVTLSLPGPFTYLMISKQAFLEPGFSPTPLAQTSDAWLDVLAVQNVGRGKILEILGAAGKEGHKHIGDDKVEYYKAKVVEIETPVAGRLCVDGEFIDVSPGPHGRIRIELAKDSSQLFSIYSNTPSP